MAVSRERISSISELQLPHVFLKERPFEKTGKQSRTRQETQEKDSDQCRSLEQKFSKITIEKDPSKILEKEECQSIVWSQLDEELGHLAKKFAPHQMALERFQENMRKFLQEKARELAPQPVKEMSEQERERYLEMLIEMFRDIKLIKLKELFRNSFFHEVCLRRIQYIASEKLEPLREAILETEEIIQTFLQMLLSDREWTLETQFHHDVLDNSLTQGKQKVGKLLEESVFFQGQLPPEDIIRYTATESRISFALGLKIDFLDKLNLFNDELTSHWSLEEWILNFLSNNYEDIDDEDLKKDLSKELLIEIGFRDNSQAIKTILTRSALLFGHVEPIEFVKRFVKDELKYHPFFAQELYRFPYTDEACTHCEIKVFEKMIDVMHMNLDRVDDSGELYKQYVSKHIDDLRDGNSVILFHGTDDCSAIDILNRGIDTNLGMPKQDFSDGFGFYLNNDYKYSETWSFSQTRKPAVLVFKVPKTFLDKSSSLDLSEEDKRSEWLQTVTEYRSGRPSRKLRNKLKTYDIIKGPISQPSDDESKSFEPRENSHQICITNEDCADEIREFLSTVIFYE